MSNPLSEILNQLPEARRERILAEADRLQAEYLTHRKLRESENPTQPDPDDTHKAR